MQYVNTAPTYQLCKQNYGFIDYRLFCSHFLACLAETHKINKMINKKDPYYS